MIQPADALPDGGAVAVDVSGEAETWRRAEFHARRGRLVAILRDQFARFDEDRDECECKECKGTNATSTRRMQRLCLRESRADLCASLLTT